MSKILIVGASGFIGSHLALALNRAGHEIVCAIKHLPPPQDIHEFTCIRVDYTCDFNVDVWRERVSGIDIVINAVGIIREHGEQTFEALHEWAPKALFSACAAADILIVQISALGADEMASSRYHLSKKAADDYLLSITAKAIIVQPSLVYGPGGASASLFNLMASLPVIPLPGAGDQKIQPIHIDDLTQAIVALIETDQYYGQRLSLVGSKPITLQQYLDELRDLMGLGPGRFMHIPVMFVNIVAQIGKWSGKGMLDIDTWQMLQRGNTADCSTTRELLGREPRPVRKFASGREAKHLALSALLSWLLLVLRMALATVWLVAGVVSLGIYPVEESYVLLARVGISGTLAPITLYGAAAMDIALGLGTLFLQNRRLLWIAQGTLIGIYTVTITFFLPEFWLHPFGPLIKNLPILAAILLLYKLEKF